MKIFHIIQDKDSSIIFFPETMDISFLSKEAASVIKMSELGHSVKYISKKSGIKDTVVKESIKKVKDFSSRRTQKYDYDDELHLKNGIGKFIVNVSQKCNMRCRYCYAEGGSYSNWGMMSEETAIKTMKYFSKNFDIISNILFFGGEPLLNIHVIQRICEEVSNWKDIPRFGVVTNGTILTKKIIKVLKKYRIGITVSIDGSERIHNYLRPFLNGKGTYDTIVKNLQLFRDELGNISYEGTYTREHQKMEISYKDVLDHLRNNLKFKIGTLVPAVSSEASNFSPENMDFSETTKFSLGSVLNGKIDTEVLHVLYLLIRKKKLKYICPIGVSVFAVDINGDIYPCQMFIGDKTYKMGNVKKNIPLEKQLEYKQVVKRLQITNKEINLKCKKCWASPLCRWCPGAAYIRTGKIELRETICNDIKFSLEKFLLNIALIRKNADLWRRFIKVIKEYAEDKTSSENLI